MKKYTTSERLHQIMNQRGLKQIDILILAKPYCEKYKVKLNKNDLSQYVNGKVEPGQTKLSILGLALNVNEAWLMGYDVSMSREPYDEKSAPADEGESEGEEFIKQYESLTESERADVRQFVAFKISQRGSDQ